VTTRPWLMPLILGFSLGCNALLGGFVITQQTRALLAPSPPSVQETMPLRPVQLIRAMIARLPRDDAAIMRDAFRGHVMDIADAQRKVLMAARDTRAVLAAPVLDRSALEQAVAAQGEARAGVGNLLRQVMVPALERLSPEGRRAIAGFTPASLAPANPSSAGTPD
jgi:uncharacterized membrane protein